MAIKTIDPTTLKAWLDKNKTILIDVREPSEHHAENIPGALSIPMAIIAKDTLPNFQDKQLVIHCQAGKRSMNACEKLVAEIPSLEVFTLEGGINAWIQQGYSVNRN